MSGASSAPVALQIAAWVGEADDPRDREFRQAIHTVLEALTSIPGTSEWIALKGAILLALRYHLTRATRDIDFSTARRVQDVDVAALLTDIQQALPASVERLPYGLACRIQSHEIRPASADASFPTLRISIGYAPALDAARTKRLRGPSGSPDRLTLDLSFNEPLLTLEWLSLGASHRSFPAYSLVDFVAEKLRAMLQQPERHRSRPQDAFDLDVLLARQPTLHTEAVRTEVLRVLRAKSEERGVRIARGGLRGPDVRALSARDYATLADQLMTPPPPFDEMYERVAAYYDALPW